MKTLFTGCLIAIALLSGSPIIQFSEQPHIEMQIQSEEALYNVVKVFDYNGNLLKELKVDDVSSDEISIADYFLLESSHFAFSYSGDYYYLRD